jgi:hypothetical protein
MASRLDQYDTVIPTPSPSRTLSTPRKPGWPAASSSILSAVASYPVAPVAARIEVKMTA